MPLTSRREFLAPARLVVLLGTALPALAQVAGDFVKVTNLELSSGTPALEYENVGQKPITAFAIENLTGEHKGELVIVEYPYGSLAPAERRGGLQVWKGLDAAQLHLGGAEQGDAPADQPRHDVQHDLVGHLVGEPPHLDGRDRHHHADPRHPV